MRAQDQTRDTLEAWHTDVASVLTGVWRRCTSTVLTPGEMQNAYGQGPMKLMEFMLCDAWRSRLHLTQARLLLNRGKCH